MSQCQILKTEYEKLEKLQQEFELELEKSIKSGNLEKTKELKLEIEEKLKSLKEKITPKELKSDFINPETNESKEIIFNTQEIIQWQQEFYKKFDLSFNEQEVKQIIRLNKAEIEKEMATYGYDTILIIPENLPTSEDLNRTMIESMPNTNETNQWVKFEDIETNKSLKTKIILTHSDQNIYQNEKANPYLKATLSKNIMQLSNLTEAQIQEKIQANQPIPINFESSGKQIQAEGLSLNEYLIFQRKYFEKNQKHLDENGWIWLTKSCSASRVVDASWDPDDRRLDVAADDLGSSDGSLGCRLSRSFELT